MSLQVGASLNDASTEWQGYLQPLVGIITQARLNGGLNGDRLHNIWQNLVAGRGWLFRERTRANKLKGSTILTNGNGESVVTNNEGNFMGFINGWIDKFRRGDSAETTSTEGSGGEETESNVGKSLKGEMRYRKLSSERLARRPQFLPTPSRLRQ